MAPLSVQSTGGGTNTGIGGALAQDLAQRSVGGDATGEQDAGRAVLLGDAHGLAGEHVDDGGLEAGGDVRRPGPRSPAATRATAVLRPLKREVVAVAEPGARQARRLGPGLTRGALDRRAAGKAEAEHARRLVEGLAGGVVPGAAQQRVAAVGFGQDQLAVAAGDDQDDGGQRRFGSPSSSQLA